MKVVMFVIATLAMPVSGFAGTELLFQTWNNHNNKWQDVSIKTDENGDAEGLFVGPRYFSYEKIKKSVDIPVEGIDKKVLTLHGPKISRKTGGTLSLEYLVNGVDGDTSFFTMKLKREDGSWRVYAHGQDKPMKKLFMYRNTVFYLGDKTVGIKSMEPKTATFYANTNHDDDLAILGAPKVLSDARAKSALSPEALATAILPATSEASIEKPI